MSLDFFKKRDIDAIGIIPARYDSVRFPGKMLADVGGLPLVIRTYQSAKSSKYLRRIIIACDDERIADVCRKYEAEFIMTPKDLPSGTDRVAWAYRHLEEESDVVVNIQGDEPLLSGEIVDELFWPFSTSLCQVGTLVKRIESLDDLLNPSVVKVVLQNDRTALYFSRSPIPFLRDIPQEKWLDSNQVFWKHIGLYAYRAEALQEFVNIQQTDLESSEKLEQLRLLQSNFKYYCVETKHELFGVDTPEDLERVNNFTTKLK